MRVRESMLRAVHGHKTRGNGSLQGVKMFSLAFIIAVLVLFVLAAWGVSSGRVSLGWAGLACYMASHLVGRL